MWSADRMRMKQERCKDRKLNVLQAAVLPLKIFWTESLLAVFYLQKKNLYQIKQSVLRVMKTKQGKRFFLQENFLTTLKIMRENQQVSCRL